MNPTISRFLKDCYKNYIPSIRIDVPEFPEKYFYPGGNPVRPVLPVQIAQNKIMIIGAFPSARFERRNGKLIPIADNLSPFSEEKYFDGREIRTQASRESLNKNYFPQLGIELNDLWITDLVKIYLFPKKHIKNCREISPHIEFVNTHKLFKKIAKSESNIFWIKREIEICNPQFIITLGEVPARVISSDYKTKNKELLNGSIREVYLNKKYKISHLAHPEIRRINKDWDEITKNAIKNLANKIKKLDLSKHGSV
ncbi:hypothetical protein Calab_2170 [Caldithrix abyssi DSM 13497]|nr:uracil-DNA glycosylase family protein [Caldithrix abyssi]EHO41780.1 hypothetical protein Calab_2170 [Caldithrix abyssi DSM 13497]